MGPRDIPGIPSQLRSKFIYKRHFCLSPVFKKNEISKVHISLLRILTCLSPLDHDAVRLVLHELLHSLGLLHTHTRADRDKFVRLDQGGDNQGCQFRPRQR